MSRRKQREHWENKQRDTTKLQTGRNTEHLSEKKLVFIVPIVPSPILPLPEPRREVEEAAELALAFLGQDQLLVRDLRPKCNQHDYFAAAGLKAAAPHHCIITYHSHSQVMTPRPSAVTPVHQVDSAPHRDSGGQRQG